MGTSGPGTGWSSEPAATGESLLRLCLQIDLHSDLDRMCDTDLYGKLQERLGLINSAIQVAVQF